MATFYFMAGQRHWLDHLAPLWNALEDNERLEFFVSPSLVDYAASKGIEGRPWPAWPRLDRRAFGVVAAESDRAKLAGHTVIRFEHGVGGSFAGEAIPRGRTQPRPSMAGVHPSYAGGRGQSNVKAFLCPNHYSADRWRAAYPNTTVEIVGTPKLDVWHRADPKTRSDPPTVAISFHFDGSVVPEIKSAFGEYRDVIPKLAERRGIRLIAHSHPKAAEKVRPFYEALGIEFVRDFDAVLRQADVYAVDSFSTLYEFASLDRPVVVINASFFRREVHHGLRFWEHSDVGVVCDRPEDLSKSVTAALRDSAAVKARRAATTAELYPYRGAATERTLEVMRALEVRPSTIPFRSVAV